MGRFCSRIASTILALAAAATLTACGGGGAQSQPDPRTLTVAPQNPSLDQGGVVQFIVANENGTIVSSPVNWIIDNTAALSISQSGLACAGTWDSLTAPVICTPGPAAVVTVAAGFKGATSAPIKVFVHQHVDRVDVSLVGPPQSCLSEAGTSKYQASFFTFIGNRSVDITPTVGPIGWSTANGNVVTLSTTASGVLANQAQATAKAPGRTQIFAAAGNASSPAVDFITCPVQSITLATSTGGTSLTFAKGATAQTVNVTVVDSAGVTLLNPPITWFSTDPATVTVTASTSTSVTPGTSGSAAIGGSQAGGAGVSAACIPPNCNSGFPAPPPEISANSVYSKDAISVKVTGAAAATTVYVSSTQCGQTLGCTTAILPVTSTTGAVGTPINLPHTPNSMLISANGSRLALGNDKLGLGLMVVDSAGAVQTFTSVIGRVIGIAPNGNRIAVSDNSTGQGRVFILDPTNTAAAPLQLLINQAVSAAFSPDNFIIYIRTQNGTVYSFDTVHSLRTVSGAIASLTDIAFHPTAGFAYFAGGAPSAITVRNTCNNSLAQTIPVPAVPAFLHAMPDAQTLIGVNSPGLEIIPVATSGAGCPLAHTTTGAVTQVNFGQGNFTPLQLLVPSDGSAAYALASTLPSVLAYNFVSGSTPAIGITGGQAPIAGGITGDGTNIFVTAIDPAKAGNFKLHRIDTGLLIDAQEIQIMDVSNTQATNICGGTMTNVVCTPDLIAVKP